MPQPRATRAACDVIPPLAVSIAFEANIPCISSGEVSSLTKTTFNPLSCSFFALSGSKTICPTAQPGPAGSPIAIGHPIIGQPQNINRAYENNNSIISTIHSTTFDQGNSNIEPMLEALPNEIGYDINLAINPLGNISGHNDFIHKDYPFLIDLDLLVPLELITNNLTLQDTIDININDTSGINYGKLYFDITNGFPFQAQIMLAIPGGNNNLFSPNIIYSGIIDNNGIVI